MLKYEVKKEGHNEVIVASNKVQAIKRLISAGVTHFTLTEKGPSKPNLPAKELKP